MPCFDPMGSRDKPAFPSALVEMPSVAASEGLARAYALERPVRLKHVHDRFKLTLV